MPYNVNVMAMNYMIIIQLVLSTNDAAAYNSTRASFPAAKKLISGSRSNINSDCW